MQNRPRIVLDAEAYICIHFNASTLFDANVECTLCVQLLVCKLDCEFHEEDFEFL